VVISEPHPPLHMHLHSAPLEMGHNDGHYHNWMQTHDHGAGGQKPHTHKARQFHEENDPETKHHHALDAHNIEEVADVPDSGDTAGRDSE